MSRPARTTHGRDLAGRESRERSRPEAAADNRRDAPPGPLKSAAADLPAMTEDELLAGITDALTIAGWTWTHIIRSDRVTQGHAGLPDILAGHESRPFVLAWELKKIGGTLTHDQVRWLIALRGASGVDVRVIYPPDYDRALDVIIRGMHPRDVWPA